MKVNNELKIGRIENRQGRGGGADWVPRLRHGYHDCPLSNGEWSELKIGMEKGVGQSAPSTPPSPRLCPHPPPPPRLCNRWGLSNLSAKSCQQGKRSTLQAAAAAACHDSRANATTLVVTRESDRRTPRPTERFGGRDASTPRRGSARRDAGTRKNKSAICWLEHERQKTSHPKWTMISPVFRASNWPCRAVKFAREISTSS